MDVFCNFLQIQTLRAGRGAGDRRRKQLAVNLAVVAAAAAATLNSFGGVPAGDAERRRGGEGACKRRLGLRRRRCIVSPCLS